MTVQKEYDMGEPGVVEPRTEAGAFRAELDRDEAVRGALHPVVCEADHDRQTAPEHWRCVMAARTAIEAVAPIRCRDLTYDGHDWNSSGSPSYCRDCGIIFPTFAAIANLRSDGETR